MSKENPVLPVEIKTRWIEALRSGNYTQSQEQLRLVEYDEDADRFCSKGHCCLGVLADILDPDGWGIDESMDTWNGNYAALPMVDLPDKVLPVAVLVKPDAALLQKLLDYVADTYPDRGEMFPEPDDSRVQDILAILNDEGRLTFEQIANVIEECL